jgi:hypothetical protein
MRVHTRNGRVTGRSYSGLEWEVIEIVKAMAVAVVLAPVLFAAIVVFTAWLALRVYPGRVM